MINLEPNWVKAAIYAAIKTKECNSEDQIGPEAYRFQQEMRIEVTKWLSKLQTY